MLTLTVRLGRTESDPRKALTAWAQSLGPEWKPLLAPAVAAQAEVLGVAPELLAFTGVSVRTSYAAERMQVRWAEVLVRAEELYVILVRREPGRFRRVNKEGLMVMDESESPWNLRIHAIAHETNPSALAELQESLEETLGLSLEPFFYKSERFIELLEEGREASFMPQEAEAKAAQLLADRATRTLATAIKSSSGLLVSDAAKQIPDKDRSRTDEILDALQAEDLVATEAVVICKKTGAQVNRLPSEALLEELDSKGVRCSCGRSLKAERCEKALTITDFGRQLINGSRWLTIVLIEELLRLGVPIESIMIEQESGGDEMDCIAVISGDMVLFELKDKTFSLGNAYSFGAKIGIMRPSRSVIVTTDQVGNDAKDHFERARQAGGRRRGGYEEESGAAEVPVYIEGLSELRQKLEAIVTSVTVGDATSVLSDVLPMASVGARQLLLGWAPRDMA